MFTDFDFSTMSGATAGLVAQIMPVFLVALIAERVVFKRSPNREVTPMQIVAVIARVLIDLTIAVGLLVVTTHALVGVEVGGLEGRRAERLWLVTGLLAFVVLYRWVLLSTPLVPLITSGVALLATAFAHAIVAIARGIDSLVEGFGVATRRFPQGVAAFLFSAIDGLTTVVSSVLTVGLSDGISTFTGRIAEAFASDADGRPAGAKPQEESGDSSGQQD